jgi:hypothetical protein
MSSPRIVLAAMLAAAVSLLVWRDAWTQALDRMAIFRAEESRGLSQPFKGVTTNGQVVPDLFRIKSTGVTTRPVREAAEAFLKGLSDEQRKKTMFPVDDTEWRKWDNRHFPPRQGVSFNEMTPRQRELAFGMLGAGLSAKGLRKTEDIMKLNETLAELANDHDEYGQWLYWITVMGTPSDKEPWGWQLDGHHAIVNYFVLGDQVVMTPTFMGSEPVRADAGKFKGTIVLQDEQNKGMRLFAALDKAQQAKAVIRGRKGPTENLAQAYQDNLVLDYAGIPASELSARQQELLLDLIAEYVGNMKDGHAKVRMEEVRSHLERTHFAWIGGADPQAVFYYRIHSPVILIEFDHQSRVAPFRTNEGSRDHIHTVVRTPNGNDYGKDLLRQHHAREPHGAVSPTNR